MAIPTSKLPYVSRLLQNLKRAIFPGYFNDSQPLSRGGEQSRQPQSGGTVANVNQIIKENRSRILLLHHHLGSGTSAMQRKHTDTNGEE